MWKIHRQNSFENRRLKTSFKIILNIGCMTDLTPAEKIKLKMKFSNRNIVPDPRSGMVSFWLPDETSIVNTISTMKKLSELQIRASEREIRLTNDFRFEFILSKFRKSFRSRKRLIKNLPSVLSITKKTLSSNSHHFLLWTMIALAGSQCPRRNSTGLEVARPPF